MIVYMEYRSYLYRCVLAEEKKDFDFAAVFSEI